MKTTATIGLLVMLLMIGFGSNGHCKVRAMDGKQNRVNDRLIIKFDSSLTDDEKKQIRETYNLTVETESVKKNRRANKNDVRQSMISSVRHQGEDPQTIITALNKENGVVYAEQDAYAYALMTPDDNYFVPYQWNMSQINMESAWELATGEGVVVAVIDTGIRDSLEDFKDTNFISGYDFVNRDSDPTDDEGHGSHVAGTIAQSTNNGIGAAGIAYNCTLMPIKVLDSDGSGYYSNIVDGIYWAVDNGADIINMSLGGLENLRALSDAVDYAAENGVLVVCAAGNDSSSSSSYPAAYDNVISVSATGYDNTLASYSNYGSTIDLCAPGGDDTDYNADGYSDYILQNTFSSSDEGVIVEGYYFSAGTSCSAPHVTGVAALVKSIRPDLSADDIREILVSTADDLGSSGWDSYYGHGMVDAYNAVVTASDTKPSNISTDDDDDSETSKSAMHVSDIHMNQYISPRYNYVAATITIKDDDGNPVLGALVSVQWSGTVNAENSQSTDRNGNVVFQAGMANHFRLRPFSLSSYTITIDDVSHATFSYDSSDNIETTASI